MDPPASSTAWALSRKMQPPRWTTTAFPATVELLVSPPHASAGSASTASTEPEGRAVPNFPCRYSNVCTAPPASMCTTPPCVRERTTSASRVVQGRQVSWPLFLAWVAASPFRQLMGTSQPLGAPPPLPPPSRASSSDLATCDHSTRPSSREIIWTDSSRSWQSGAGGWSSMSSLLTYTRALAAVSTTWRAFWPKVHVPRLASTMAPASCSGGLRRGPQASSGSASTMGRGPSGAGPPKCPRMNWMAVGQPSTYRRPQNRVLRSSC
mmetsp:Transcript_14143/g.20835  ORF Transcript_14143/g.20835 Transcript_14143/m.20835 type:complete len:266 (+) Transcript_14143:431-1228(+)